MKKIALLCATTAFVMPGLAFAQSTGTADFEERGAIVVTGTRNANVGGVVVPDTTKTRAELNSEFIQRQTPGQSINEVINQLPGVSFTNNDPFGSAGGTLYHPRLRQQPHLGDVRRHSAERHRQLRALLEPVSRSGGHRSRRRQPGLDRRRQPDRLGDRQHDQLPHPSPVRDLRRAPAGLLRLVRRRQLHARLRRGRHRRVRPLGHARLRRRPAWRPTTPSTAIAASSTSSSTMPASISRSAPTATSSRPPSTTTRTATISSARCRCAPI